MFQKIFNIFLQLKRNYFFSKKKDDLVSFIKKNNFQGSRTNDELIIFEMVEDYSYWLKFIYLIWALRKKHGNFDLRWVSTRVNLRNTSGLRRYVIRVLIENSFTDKIWFKLYQALGGSLDLNFDCIKITNQNINQAKYVLSNINSKKELEELTIDGLLVGDLIYDTYLRFNSSPTVDLKNTKLLLELIAKTIKLISSIQEYLLKTKPILIVTSYSSYLQHGLLVRVALNLNIKVYNLGTFNQLITSPTNVFPYHRRNHLQYKNWEISLGKSEIPEREGRKILHKRFGGEIDPATFYMKNTAFSDINFIDTVFKHEKRILVMGHDFFDSPHIYGKMVFPDFYEWVKFIFEKSKETKYKIYFKPHPNSIGENEEIIKVLKETYSDIEFIDKLVSNKQILNEGIDLLVTCYGTVAHEFAFHGVKVVCCGQNPHELYKFCETVYTKERLLELLKDPSSINSKIDEKEICRFMYIHNYRLIESEYLLFPWEVALSNLDEDSLSNNHKIRLELMEKELKYVENM